MRKILLATASASVLCTFAMQAQAQMVVTLGGYTEFFAGLFNDELAPTATSASSSLRRRSSSRPTARPTTACCTAPRSNCRTARPTPATGVGTDEASIYVGGQWGRFELGDFDGAADTLKIYAPVVGVEQIDGDYVDFAGGQPNFGMHIPNSGDSTKIMYLTPRFAGFQGGASYTPEFGDEAQSVVQFKNTSTYKDVGEFGLNYTGEFSGFGVSVGATLTTAEGTTTGAVKDFTAWNLGAQITYGAFVFGGGYVDAGDFLVPTTGAIDNDQTAWHVGGSSRPAPSPSPLSFLDAEGYSGSNGGYSTEYRAYSVGATYSLAPGLTLETELTIFEDDFLTGTRGATTKGSNEGYVFIVGTRLDF